MPSGSKKYVNRQPFNGPAGTVAGGAVKRTCLASRSW